MFTVLLHYCFLFYRTVTREEKMYLDSCKEMVETGEEIRRGEQKKRKLEQSLEEVNGQLQVLNRHYTFLQQKNFRLKAAYLKKSMFTRTSVTPVRSIVETPSNIDSDFGDDDSDDLVKACEQAENKDI